MAISVYPAMEAVILIGVQGAGKTTFYQERFFHTHLRISLDMLRSRRREQLLLDACLKGGQPFVIDNTNTLAGSRARYIEPSRGASFQMSAYFFRVSLEDALRRNGERKLKHKVPVAAVISAFKRLQPRAFDEGFNAIYIVEVTPENQFVVIPREAGQVPS
jgi:predicted kinase